MDLSKNFSLEELTNSDVAKKNGIENIPNQEQINALKALCTNLLQPLRDLWGKPIGINSGFRVKALNDILPGSSSTSQHMKGEAADVYSDNISSLWDLVTKGDFIFDQAIYYKNRGFIHLSYKSTGTNRKQILYK